MDLLKGQFESHFWTKALDGDSLARADPKAGLGLNTTSEREFNGRFSSHFEMASATRSSGTEFAGKSNGRKVRLV